jgi:hypothetical protein
LRGERGFLEGAYAEVEESEGSPKWPMVCALFDRISSLRGSFPTVMATADWQVQVQKQARSGRGSKVSLLRNSTNTSIIPGRGSEEERMRILLQAELCISVDY